MSSGEPPPASGTRSQALDLSLGPAQEVAIIGTAGRPRRRRRSPTRSSTVRFLPNAVLAIAAPDDREAAEAVALLRDRPLVDGLPTAYVCRRFACRLPVTTPAELAAQLLEPAR